ncbi:unnamed protein product [Pleuronectes platessa]|uniref:Uncharacterized protein n=1 Tax=Pleuronectes platessa TaxID=8262 RepID=A0A9N7VJ65_PLEPL|nr:unnamed protein product [Pleuronectes platessa]
MATGGLLHSTSSPGSRPQKRKFGSLKWRGCSRAIYRALYRPSATHDIPYENRCVCGACGVVLVSVGGEGGVGGDEVSLEEALLNLQAMTPHQREGGSSDREEEAWMQLYDFKSGA